MKDRDFIFPFPPWRLFLPFMIVTMLSILNIAASTVALWIVFKMGPEILIFAALFQVGIFCFFNVKISNGKEKYASHLKRLHIFYLLESIILFFQTKNIESFNYILLFITIITTFILILIIESRYYRGCIYYRMRHIAVMYKIKDGKKLDDGKYFYEK